MKGKNQKLPYGYRYADGTIRIDEEESVVIRRIYREKQNGIPGTKIGAGLYADKIPLFSVSEKKAANMVYEILTDKRYCGTEILPAIISEKIFAGARSTLRKRTDKSADVYTVIRRLSFCAECGKEFVHAYNGITPARWHCYTKSCVNYKPDITEEKYYSMIKTALNSVIKDPKLLDIKQVLTEYIPDESIREQEAHINTMLSEREIDTENAVSEIFALAEAKYDLCTYSRIPYLTEELKNTVKEYEPSETVNIKLLKRRVDRITVDGDKQISFHFKNGKVMTFEGNANE